MKAWLSHPRGKIMSHCPTYLYPFPSLPSSESTFQNLAPMRLCRIGHETFRAALGPKTQHGCAVISYSRRGWNVDVRGWVSGAVHLSVLERRAAHKNVNALVEGSVANGVLHNVQRKVSSNSIRRHRLIVVHNWLTFVWEGRRVVSLIFGRPHFTEQNDITCQTTGRCTGMKGSTLQLANALNMTCRLSNGTK